MLSEPASVNKVAGVKRAKRAIRGGRAVKALLASDADPFALAPVEALCSENGVPVERGFTMAQLGRGGGIAVGAAVVTVLEDG